VRAPFSRSPPVFALFLFFSALKYSDPKSHITISADVGGGGDVLEPGEGGTHGDGWGERGGGNEGSGEKVEGGPPPARRSPSDFKRPR